MRCRSLACGMRVLELNSTGKNKILENRRETPESNPVYPWSGLSDSSENAHPWIGKLLERPKNSPSEGCLIQGLGSNSVVRWPGGICQHTQEKLQELVFLLLSTSLSNAGWTLADREGRHQSMQQGAKSLLIPSVKHLGRESIWPLLFIPH